MAGYFLAFAFVLDFAVDFVVVQDDEGTWTPYAIELNLRKGGTTHPFLTLQFLCGGNYDGDVGSLRGTTNNLASAVGTAVAGALLVTLLSTAVMRQLADNPTLPIEIQSEVNLDSITFVSNERLQSVIAATNATAEQKAEALRINTDSRLLALKIGFLIMAGLALLTILPAGRLPNYRPGEIPEG